MTELFNPYGIVYETVWQSGDRLLRKAVLTEEQLPAGLLRNHGWIQARVQRMTLHEDLVLGRTALALLTTSKVVLVFSSRFGPASDWEAKALSRDLSMRSCSRRTYTRLFEQ